MKRACPSVLGACGGANAKYQGRRTTNVKGRTKNEGPRTKDGRLHRSKNCAKHALRGLGGVVIPVSGPETSEDCPREAAT